MSIDPVPDRVARADLHDRLQLTALGVLREPAVPILLLAALTQLWRRSWLDLAVFGGSAAIILWDRPRSPDRFAVSSDRLPASSRSRATSIAVASACLLAGLLLSPLPRSSWQLSGLLAVPGVIGAAVVLNPASAHEHALLRLLSGARSESPAPSQGGPSGTTGAPVMEATLPTTVDAHIGETTVKRDAGNADESRRGWLVWLSLGLILAVVELVAFLYQPDPRVDSPDHPTISTIVEPWFAAAPIRALITAVWLWCGWWLVGRIVAITESR